MSVQPTIDELKIEEDLAKLRTLWREWPARRPIIIRQARALQIAKENLQQKPSDRI